MMRVWKGFRLPNLIVISASFVLMVILFMNVPQCDAATTLFSEDFTTTTYRDNAQTNATGWGTGAVQLPNMNPTIVGEFRALNHPTSIYVDGEYAYVSDFRASLAILNVANPAHPISVSYLGWPNEDGGSLCVEGNFLYIADGPAGLRIANITDISNPTLVARYDTPDYTKGVCVKGDLAYVADHRGFLVLNVSNPANPTWVASYDPPGWALDVWVAGDYAYLALATAGLQVLDVSDPSNPTLVGAVDTPDWAYEVFVEGDYAYIADEHSGLQVINIANPTNPLLVASCDTPGQAYGLWVSGNYAYIADGYSTPLRVIDISNPLTPVLVGTCRGPGGTGWDVCISGNYALIAAGETDLQIAQIADLIQPSFAGNYNPGALIGDVCIEGDFAYTTRDFLGLLVFDISNPTNPTLAGAVDTHLATSVCVEGNYAYLTDWSAGLKIIRITNPRVPAIVGSWMTPGLKWDVEVAGNYAYIASDTAGLYIVDITEPTLPHTVSVCDTPGTAVGVTLSGDYAFVSDQASGLHIIDISNPRYPTIVATYDSPGATNDVVIAGDYAYLADNDTILILDIKNPESPTLLGTFDSPGSAIEIVVEGSLAFVACDGMGLWVINISNPFSPTEFGSYSTTYAKGVSVEGDYVFLGAGHDGLDVVEIMQNRARKYYSYAVAQSLSIHDSGVDLITKATITISDTVLPSTSVNYYLSADDGAHWELVSADVEHEFANIGNKLKWRAILQSADIFHTPQISSLSINIETQLPSPTLDAPLNGTILTNNTPTLNWTALTGAHTYFIQLDTLNSFDSPDFFADWSSLPNYTLQTLLTDAIWYWRVAANDSEGIMSNFSVIHTFTIDTTAPIFVTTPTDQFVEFSSDFVYNINATDPADVDTWWLNDTSNFAVDGNGVITNSTQLELQDYGLQIWVNDTLGHSRSAIITVSVIDTTSPQWVQSPQNQGIEYGDAFSYTVDATDSTGIHHWWVNNTTYFTIDINGQITNATILAEGLHYLEVRAYDAYDNYCKATISILVEDTTNPLWLTVPEELVIDAGQALRYHLDAWDLSGISQWLINDSSRFGIFSNGTLFNLVVLEPGSYVLQVTALDPYGNTCSAIFTVFALSPTSSDSDNSVLLLSSVLSILGATTLVIAIGVFLQTRRLPKKT